MGKRRLLKDILQVGVLVWAAFFHPPLAFGQALALGSDPSDAEIQSLRLFELPLVPSGKPPVAGENAALSQALHALAQEEPNGPLAALEAFTRGYPESRWVCAVEVNRGLLLKKRGYFSRARQAFETAWRSRSPGAPPSMEAKRLEDRALAELLWFHASFGEEEALKDGISLLKGRTPFGESARIFETLETTLWVMQNDPKHLFRCGPMALQEILFFKKIPRYFDPALVFADSKGVGFSLARLEELAGKVSLSYLPARRSPGAEIPLPAVVHWKAGHYSALLEEKNGLYRFKDPVFGEGWLSAAALDEESSGAFLVPSPLPEGWTALSREEAEKIWGKGLVSGEDPQQPPCTAERANGSCASCGGGGDAPPAGMPVADLDLSQAALIVEDVPLRYRPPIGPEISIRLAYHQRTARQLPASGFGPNWSFNWQGLVQYSVSCPQQAAGYELIPPGGGVEFFDPGARTTYTLSRMEVTATFDASQGCLAGLPSGFVRRLSDGSEEYYEAPVTVVGQVRLYLTRLRDAQGNEITLSYDTNGRLTGLTDPLGRVTTFAYDGASFRIRQVTDPFGRTASFTYDAQGRLQAVTDQIGLTTSFTYETSGLPSDWLSSMTTPYGTTTFTHGTTSGGRWVETSDPEVLRRRVQLFQSQNVPESILTVPSGISGTTSWLNYRNTFYWDEKAMEQAPLSPSSARVYHWLHSWNFSNKSNILESTKNPLESRVWYNYEGQSNVVGAFMGMMPKPSKIGQMVTGPDGTLVTKLEQYAYNAFGLPVTYIDPKGREFRYVYAENGVDLLETYAGGELIEKRVYNAQHLPVTVIDAAGQAWKYSYTPQGKLQSVTSPAGETTSYQYDGLGRLTAVIPPQPGAQVTFTYDALDRVRTRTDAVQGTLTYTYDDLDRVVRVEYPDGTTEEFIYDKLDMVEYKDRQNRVTAYRYDGRRRLVSVTDAKGQVTSFGWCACGSMESLTDPKGNVTRWEYDVQGRLTAKVYPDGKSVRYTYDAGAGRLWLVEDAKGQVKYMRYEVDGRLAKVWYTGQRVRTPNLAYTYEPVLGRLESMVDGTGIHRYFYHPFGQVGGGKLARREVPVGSATAVLEYGYDADGRLVSRKVDGVEERLEYANGQLVSVTNPLGAFGYQYDAATAQLVRVLYPNGQRVEYGYHTSPQDRGRLKDLVNLGSGGQVVSKFSYTYLPAGDIESWQQQLGPDPVADVRNYVFQYDAISQVEGAQVTFGDGSTPQNYSYRYDAAGNRTLEETPKKRQEFGVNELNQLTWVKPDPHEVEGFTSRPAAVEVNGSLVAGDGSQGFETTVPAAAGETTPLTIRAIAPDGTVREEKKHILNQQEFRYDENGNLMQDAERIYVWDAENRLVRVVWLSARPQNQPTVVEMEYDGEGRRVRIVAKHGETVLSDKRFVWCDGVQPCEERDSSGAVVKRFYEHGFQVVNETQTENFYYTKDHLGSIREVVDSTTAVRARYDYDPWGRRSKLAGDIAADFGFTGFYRDTAIGLDLTWYRAYSPELGRWLSRDPLGAHYLEVINVVPVFFSTQSDLNFILGFLTGQVALKVTIESFNSYIYSTNNFIRYVDPLGLVCGSGWNEPLVPDKPLFLYDFRGPCQVHDMCYSTCGKPRVECDINFLRDLFAECGYDVVCLRIAWEYFIYVRLFGKVAYDRAQKNCNKLDCGG